MWRADPLMASDVQPLPLLVPVPWPPHPRPGLPAAPRPALLPHGMGPLGASCRTRARPVVSSMCMLNTACSMNWWAKGARKTKACSSDVEECIQTSCLPTLKWAVAQSIKSPGTGLPDVAWLSVSKTLALRGCNVSPVASALSSSTWGIWARLGRAAVACQSRHVGSSWIWSVQTWPTQGVQMIVVDKLVHDRCLPVCVLGTAVGQTAAAGFPAGWASVCLSELWAPNVEHYSFSVRIQVLLTADLLPVIMCISLLKWR